MPMFCLALLFTIGCGNQHGDGNDQLVFRYNESKGITSLDPAQARTMGNIWATNQLFNGLIQLNDSLHVEPSIARSWDIQQDGKLYAFHLRSDVLFHDHPLFENGVGRKVTAHDFVNSFQRIMDEKNLSPGRWVFAQVDIARNGGFIAINDTLLHIYLKQPFPPFLGMLSMPYCAVVPHEVCDALGQDFGRNPIGTGPFQFKEWHQSVKLVLHRNPRYFEKDENGNALPYIDAIGITFISDAQSVFLEFLKGNLDMLSGLEDGSFKDALLTPNGKLQPDMKHKVIMQTMPFLNTEYLGFVMDTTTDVMRNSPLRIKKVRQAINYGFDRKRMMRYIRNNIGTAGEHGFLPDGLPGINRTRTIGYTYNPQLSRTLLKEAGFPNGEGLPEIVLHTTSQYVDLCEFVQHQLGELGIRLRIEVNPGATHGALVNNGQVAFFRKSWMADYADAENYLALFVSSNRTPNGPNYTMFSNPEYDRMYASALRESNDTVRYTTYHKMDSLIMSEAPVVVLYYDQVMRFLQPHVSGLEPNAMNLLSLKKVTKIRTSAAAH